MAQKSPAALAKEYLNAALRHWKILIAFNLLVIGLIVMLLIAWPRTYRSEAKLWIKLGRENSKLDPTAATGDTISIQESDREDEIRSVMDVLGSRGVLSATVDEVGAKVVLGDEPLPGADVSSESEKDNGFTKALKQAFGSVIAVVKSLDPVSDRETAIIAISKNIEVSAERKSNVVSLAFDTDSPALAQAVVTSLINQYKAEHARIHHTIGSQSFFSAQRAGLQDRVAESAAAVRSAKDRLGIASTAGQKQILEAEMLNVQLAKLDVVRAQAENEARVRKIQQQLSMEPERVLAQETTVPNTGRDSLRLELYQLQVKRMELEATYTSDHPMLARLRRQEEEARKELAQETTESRNQVTESLNQVRQQLLLELARAEASVSGNKAKFDSLSAQEESVVSQIADLNAADIEIRRLEQELRLAEQSYAAYADKYEDARLNEALNESAISNISVAQRPTFQEKPISPSKLLLILMGIAMMGSGSIAIIAGSQLFRSTDDPIASHRIPTDRLDSTTDSADGSEWHDGLKEPPVESDRPLHEALT